VAVAFSIVAYHLKIQSLKIKKSISPQTTIFFKTIPNRIFFVNFLQIFENFLLFLLIQNQPHSLFFQLRNFFFQLPL